MTITRGCIALALGTALVFGCSKDSKETEESEETAAKAGDEDEAGDDDGAGAEDGEGEETAAANEAKVPKPLGALLRGGGEKAAKGAGLSIFGGGLGGGATPPAVAVADTEEGGAQQAAKVGGAPDPGGAKAPAGPANAECTKLADHLMDIAMSEMAGQIPEDQKAMMEPMLAQAKREVVKQCAMFPAEVRSCMLSAQSVQGLEECATAMGGMSGAGSDWEEDDFVDTSDMPDPVGPPPAWDGKDASCRAVGQHVLALAKHMMSGDPESAQMLEQMGQMIVDEVVKQCESGPWPEAARRCVLKAQSESDLESCESQIPGGL